MSFLDKIKQQLLGEKTASTPVKKAAPIFPHKKAIKHEFINFAGAYRIGILCFLYDHQSQKPIHEYQKKLERLGFECEVLIFTNKRECDPQVYLQSFSYEDMSKEGIPNSPRTDRFIIRRYDILMNLYFNPCPQLLYLAQNSNAKCRVSPFLDHFTSSSDVLIPVGENYEIANLIEQINKTLEIQPYVRKEV